MIGPYYRPQMTSLMSIAHRASGVFLGVIGAPLLLWWAAALATGPAAYVALTARMSGWWGRLVLLACAVSLAYHLCNGIRHLVWDSGRALELRSAYSAGWLALIGTVLVTALLLGAML
jgi:succinate dehydrogenase cytochrome b subunit